MLRHCSSRTCPSCPTRRCTPNSNLIGDGFADFEVPSFLSYSAFPVVISKSKGSMVRHTRRWHELAETEPPARKSLTLRDLSMLATLVTKAATPSHSVPPENRWTTGRSEARKSRAGPRGSCLRLGHRHRGMRRLLALRRTPIETMTAVESPLADERKIHST